MEESSREQERASTFREKLKATVAYDAQAAQADGTTAPVGTPNNPSNEIFTLANVITFCRLILTCLFFALFIQGTNRYLAVALYAIAAITDFLDGLVARSTNTVSWVGKIMDPIMDRFLLATGVLALVITGELPAWVAIFVIGRDAYLAIGALILQKYRRRPIDVVFIGKFTTACLMFGFADLLLGLPIVPGLKLVPVSWLPGLNAQPAAIGIFFIYVGVVCSAITAGIYTKEAIKIIREAREEQERS